MAVENRSGVAFKPIGRGHIMTAAASIAVVGAFGAYCLIEHPSLEVALVLGWAVLLWFCALWSYPWFIRTESERDASIIPAERDEETDGR